MPRIAFRRILPILQFAFFIAIVFVAQARDQAKKAAQEAERASAPIGWVMMIDHSPPPVDVDIVMSLSAPAVVAAFVLVAAPAAVLGVEESQFAWLPGGSDNALLIPVALFVVIQWYLIGRWYDRRVGLIPQPVVHSPSPLRRVASWAALVMAVLLGCLFIVFSLNSYVDSYFVISLAGWSFIGAMIQVQKIRRWRGDPSALTSLRLS